MFVVLGQTANFQGEMCFLLSHFICWNQYFHDSNSIDKENADIRCGLDLCRFLCILTPAFNLLAMDTYSEVIIEE